MATTRGIKGVGDLSLIRACITGAEPIRPAALTRFVAEFGQLGLETGALKPAYGLAECALAVTGTPVDEVWRVTDSAKAEAAGSFGQPIVSCGIPLDGYEVRCRGDGAAGELLVRGPSLAEVYSDGSRVCQADGWFATGDLGWIDDGHVYVMGRTDDVFKVGGRKIFALEVERSVCELPVARPGRAIAFPDEDGRMCVVLETVTAGDLSIDEAMGVVKAVRDDVFRTVGLWPRVVVLKRGALPLTASGKVMRAQTREAVQAGRLEALTGSR